MKRIYIKEHQFYEKYFSKIVVFIKLIQTIFLVKISSNQCVVRNGDLRIIKFWHFHAVNIY
jgi:hypothetical protein